MIESSYRHVSFWLDSLPEPLRWLAVRGVLAAVAAADRATEGPARWRSWLMRAIAGR